KVLHRKVKPLLVGRGPCGDLSHEHVEILTGCLQDLSAGRSPPATQNIGPEVEGIRITALYRVVLGLEPLAGILVEIIVQVGFHCRGSSSQSEFVGGHPGVPPIFVEETVAVPPSPTVVINGYGLPGCGSISRSKGNGDGAGGKVDRSRSDLGSVKARFLCNLAAPPDGGSRHLDPD